MFFSRDFLNLAYTYGSWLGLPPSNTAINLGTVFRHFFANDLVPLLLFAVLFSRYAKIKTPKLPLHSVLAGVFTLSATYLTLAIIQFGPFARLEFFGFLSFYSSALIYISIASYLLYVFRHESFVETLVVIALGVIIVGALWELPLNYMTKGNYHPVMFALGYLQHYVPFFLWFYVFRNVYRSFLVNQWFLALLSTCIIVSLTVFWAATRYPFHGLGSAMRLSYACLLVFFPFHFYTKKQRQR